MKVNQWNLSVVGYFAIGVSFGILSLVDQFQMITGHPRKSKFMIIELMIIDMEANSLSIVKDNNYSALSSDYKTNLFNVLA